MTAYLFPLASRFTTFFARACAEIKILSFWTRNWPTSLGLWFLYLLLFFSLSFFSFSYLFAAVIDLLLGLLPVQKLPRKHHRDGQFIPLSSHVSVVGKFAPSFSLKFLSILVHISCSTELITMIWASLERSFPAAEVEKRWCQFWLKVHDDFRSGTKIKARHE